MRPRPGAHRNGQDAVDPHFGIVFAQALQRHGCVCGIIDRRSGKEVGYGDGNGRRGVDDERIGIDVIRHFAGGSILVLVHGGAAEVGDSRADRQVICALRQRGRELDVKDDRVALRHGGGRNRAARPQQRHVGRSEGGRINRGNEEHLNGADRLVGIAGRLRAEHADGVGARLEIDGSMFAVSNLNGRAAGRRHVHIADWIEVGRVVVVDRNPTAAPAPAEVRAVSAIGGNGSGTKEHPDIQPDRPATAAAHITGSPMKSRAVGADRAVERHEVGRHVHSTAAAVHIPETGLPQRIGQKLVAVGRKRNPTPAVAAFAAVTTPGPPAGRAQRAQGVHVDRRVAVDQDRIHREPGAGGQSDSMRD